MIKTNVKNNLNELPNIRESLIKLYDSKNSLEIRIKTLNQIHYKLLDIVKLDLRGTKFYSRFNSIMIKKSYAVYYYLLLVSPNFAKSKMKNFTYNDVIKNHGVKMIENIISEVIENYIKLIKNIEKNYNIISKDIADFETVDFLINLNDKYLIRKASGIVLSDILAGDLIKFHKKYEIKLPKDDGIDDLRNNILSKIKNKTIKNYFYSKHNDFKIATEVRKDSAHPKNKAPSRDDIIRVKKFAEKFRLHFDIL